MLEIVSGQTLQLEAFRADVAMGLSRGQKTLPSRWLYDNQGCEIFEEITRLDEYYPTRTETDILREQCAGDRGLLRRRGRPVGVWRGRRDQDRNPD